MVSSSYQLHQGLRFNLGFDLLYPVRLGHFRPNCVPLSLVRKLQVLGTDRHADLLWLLVAQSTHIAVNLVSKHEVDPVNLPLSRHAADVCRLWQVGEQRDRLALRQLDRASRQLHIC